MEITKAVIEYVPKIPITAKIRAGWDQNSIVAIDAGLLLEDIGIKAITLHARTTKQGFSGNSNWDIIKNLKKEVNIPVIGNGDVNNVNDYVNIIKQTNCDGVMIGRATLGNPWIFRNIIAYLNNQIFHDITLKEKIELCIKHIRLLEDNKNEIACINLSKKHLSYYLKGFNNSSNIRKNIMRQNNINDIKNILLEIINYYD